MSQLKKTSREPKVSVKLDGWVIAFRVDLGKITLADEEFKEWKTKRKYPGAGHYSVENLYIDMKSMFSNYPYP